MENTLTTPRPGVIAANSACIIAMVLWAFAFPIAEVLLTSWGTIALVFYRQVIGMVALLLVWQLLEGWSTLRSAPWGRGCVVGGIGFGFGGLLLLFGQKLSDPVTPAIAAAMMPIAGAVLEVTLDQRKIQTHLVIGIILAILGGILATGAKLSSGSFGVGALLCLLAVILFAWATRVTTRNFQSITPLGQTTITLTGAAVFVLVVYMFALATDMPGADIGSLDTRQWTLLLISSLASLAFAQLLWIWGAGSLGIFLASFHMNAVPFYVMVIALIFLGDDWSWMQALGALCVAIGVMVSQSSRSVKESSSTDR